MAEALVLLDREGLEAMTMRRIADQLGVSPMALYNHVSSKKDLLQGIAEHLVGQIEFSCDDPDWRERIRTCFRRLREACLAHPSAVRLMESLEAAPPAAFNPMEITLAALDEAGLDPDNAIKAYFLLMNFTMGQVSYEVRGPFEALDPAEALRSRRLQGAGFVHVRRAVTFDAWDFNRAFEFGLSAILAGLQQVGGSGTPD